MAEELRTQSGVKQPITRHPLFSATVALWFGALFGLGSLAIRPGLLESVVLSTGIDSLIPAAAPPLGWTARILLAVALTATGGVIGALLARFIARPKPVVVERKRSAGAIAEAGIGSKFLQQAANEAAPEDEEAAHPVEAASANAHANRRRQLALQDDDRHPEYHDRAPVPGGSAQILDVTDFNLEGFEVTDDNDTPVSAQDDDPQFEAVELEAAEPEKQNKITEVAEKEQAAALSNRLFETYASKPPVETQDIGPAHFGQRDFAAPQSGDAEPGFAILPLGSENGETGADGAAATGTETDPPLFARPEVDAETEEGGANSIENADPETLSGAPKSPVFGQTADDEDNFWDDDETAEAGPLAPPADFTAEDSGIDSDSGLAPEGDPAIAEEFLDGEPADVTDTPGEDQTEAEIAADAICNDRIANADLSELSPVELLERLALTLERRRQQAIDAASVSEIEPHLELSAESETETEAAELQSDELPAANEQFEPAEQSNETDAEEDAAVGEVSAPFAPPPVVIPAALRPVGLDEDEDDDILPSFVPRRTIGASPSAVKFGFASPADSAALSDQEAANQTDEPAPFAAQADGGDESTDEATDKVKETGSDVEDIALEEGYSSLLNLTRQAEPDSKFIRIDEPETDSGEFEPVVVFPAQEVRRAPFAKPNSPGAKPSNASKWEYADPSAESQPAPVDEEPRRFDAPPSQPARGTQDAAETERALRSALANLQRMSGAA